MIEAQALSQIPGIRHGFFGNTGGVSQGIYASLNCGMGSDDNKEHVLSNRSHVAAHLGLAPKRLITAYQIHSPEVLTVTKPWSIENAPKADGMVTNEPNIGLSILTADCAPVLFMDHNAGVIGAASRPKTCGSCHAVRCHLLHQTRRLSSVVPKPCRTWDNCPDEIGRASCRERV